MGEVNVLLKRVFTIFNIIFALAGGVILGLAMMSQILTNSHSVDMTQRATGLIVLYLTGSITMVVAILGAYGAHRENKGCLIAFLVCTLVGGLVMIRLGTPFIATRPRLEPVLREGFQHMLPLDQANPNVQDMFNTLQSRVHCCGIFDYKDWGTHVPESCECNMKAKEQGACKTITYRNIMESQRTKTIYSQTCFAIVLSYALLGADIIIGVALTLFILAVLGVILSSIMIHQMRPRSARQRTTVLLTVPTVFSTAPPKYQELNNPPIY
ncbi:tetraspanin-8-like [Nelusetta ayraudi]|uniref:tetraspanin-8-like n=1 Tax=Nelusetta ayraudi TaxID=303726 RepID=UPI003F71D61F